MTVRGVRPISRGPAVIAQDVSVLATNAPGVIGAAPYAPRSTITATSTTSVTIGTGPKTFAVQQSTFVVAPGQRVRASAVGSAQWLEGLVSAYGGVDLTIDVDLLNGSGTFAIWNIGLAGEQVRQDRKGHRAPAGVGVIEEAPMTGASYARKNGGWADIASSSYQPFDADLLAIAALTGINTIYYRSGVNVWSPLTLGGSLTFTGGVLDVAPGYLPTAAAPLISPAFSGNPTAPTPALNDSDTSISTTAFVQNTINNVIVAYIQPTYAPLASPVFTGNPRAPNPPINDYGNSIATTYWTSVQVGGWLSLYAPLASPVFTGDPRVPTPAANDNDTSIANTTWVVSWVSNQFAAQFAAIPIDGAAWTAFIPPLAVGSGALAQMGSYGGRYKVIGKTCFFDIVATFVDIGTAAGTIKFQLPRTPSGAVFVSGMNTSTKKQMQGTVLTVAGYVDCYYYDGTFPLANNQTIIISGSYEIA